MWISRLRRAKKPGLIILILISKNVDNLLISVDNLLITLVLSSN